MRSFCGLAHEVREVWPQRLYWDAGSLAYDRKFIVADFARTGLPSPDSRPLDAKKRSQLGAAHWRLVGFPKLLEGAFALHAALYQNGIEPVNAIHAVLV